MTYFKAILLGLIQGVTEFLPVSSSGHLVLLERLGFAPPSVFFNLILHVATLLSVLLVMRREVWEMLRHPVRGDMKYILVASLPTVAVALLFERCFPAVLEGSMLSFGFLLTSCLLLLPELVKGRARECEIGAGNSFLTGLAQGIAVLPGVSRSGATIAALELAGVDGERAARFSFLLSLPVIAGGFLFEGIQSGFSLQQSDIGVVLAASLAAFLGGIVAANFFLRKIKKGLKPFAVYTFLLGIASFFLL